MSNNTSERSNESLEEPLSEPVDAPLAEPLGEPLDTKLDEPIGETGNVGSPTQDEHSPTVDLDELWLQLLISYSWIKRPGKTALIVDRAHQPMPVSVRVPLHGAYSR